MAESAAPSLQLVAVVVSHNRLEKLRTTLARLLAHDRAELAGVVVVDNASTDGTRVWLAEQTDPRLDVLRSSHNEGGAGGFARGMRRAIERHAPDWLVVMDDDARPAPGALAAFHALAAGQGPGWDAVAAAVYFPDGRICEMNRPSRNPFWHWRAFLRTALGGGRRGFHLGAADYEGPGIQVDVTSFVGFFISAEAVRRIGYPEPGLFIYGDDGLYTLGLSRSGGRIGFEPGIRFEHDISTFQAAGVGQSAQRGRFIPLWKAYYYHRNLLLLYRLAAGWFFWPVMAVILPRWLLKVRAHAGQRRIFLRLLTRAVQDGLARRLDLPHAEVERLAQEGAGR